MRIELRLASLLFVSALLIAGLTATWVEATDHSNKAPMPSYQNGFARHAAESSRPQDRVGLVGFWTPSLGPTGLTLRDWSRYANHGTLTNMDLATDWVVDAEQGYTLEFDGSTNYVDITNSVSHFNFTTQPFTLMGWVKVDTFDHSWTLAANEFGSVGYRASGGVVGPLLWHTRGTTPLTLSSANNLILLDVWHQVAFMYTGTDGDKMLYIDGNQVATGSFTGSINSSSQNLWLAASPTGGVPFDDELNGQIAQVRVYNRILSSTEVWEQYQDPPGIVRLADPTSVHSIQAAVATPQVIIIGWTVPDWLAVVLSNLQLASIIDPIIVIE